MPKLILPCFLIPALLLFCATGVLANHPVLVEGNCDSPVPGTTLVSPGTCGDFDGDGRIGTAEDTDGADRIFGTLRAALGAGTGAAAGTGANSNGSVTIVTSGRFAETLSLPITTGTNPPPLNPGNITLQAAPGVEAGIDAVLQGDPAGGNATRQAAPGIVINMPSSRVVTLRNLTIRNFSEGVQVAGESRVIIENCRFENNRDFAIHVLGTAQVTIINCRVYGTGRRLGAGGAADTPNPGDGIAFAPTSTGDIVNTTVASSFGAGVVTSTGNVSLTNVNAVDNSPDFGTN